MSSSAKSLVTVAGTGLSCKRNSALFMKASHSCRLVKVSKFGSSMMCARMFSGMVARNDLRYWVESAALIHSTSVRKFAVCVIGCVVPSARKD